MGAGLGLRPTPTVTLRAYSFPRGTCLSSTNGQQNTRGWIGLNNIPALSNLAMLAHAAYATA